MNKKFYGATCDNLHHVGTYDNLEIATSSSFRSVPIEVEAETLIEADLKISEICKNNRRQAIEAYKNSQQIH